MKNDELKKHTDYEKSIMRYKRMDNTMYEMIKKYCKQEKAKLDVDKLVLVINTTIENTMRDCISRGGRIKSIMENIKTEYRIDVKDYVVNGAIMKSYIQTIKDDDICKLIMEGRGIDMINLYHIANINQEQIKMLIGDETIIPIIIMVMIMTEKTKIKMIINETIMELANMTDGYPTETSKNKMQEIETASLMIDIVKSYIKFSEGLNKVNASVNKVNAKIQEASPEAYIMNNILEFIKNETTLIVKEMRYGYMDYVCRIVLKYGITDSNTIAEVLRITSKYKSEENSIAEFGEYEKEMGPHVYKMTINNRMIYPYMINYMENDNEYKINDSIYIGPIIFSTINDHLSRSGIMRKIDNQMTFKPSNNLMMNWLSQCPSGHRLYIVGHKITKKENEYIYTFGYRGTDDKQEIMVIPNSNICVMGDKCYYKKDDNITALWLRQPIQVGSEIPKNYMICNRFMEIKEKESEMYIVIGHGITHPTNLTTIPIKTENESNRTIFVMPENVYLVQLTHTASTLFLNDPIAIMVSHIYNYKEGMVKYIKKWIEKQRNGVKIEIDNIFSEKEQENMMIMFKTYSKKEDTKIQNILNSGDKTKEKLEKILNENCSFSEVYCPGDKVLNKNINLNYEYNSVYSGDYLYYFKTGIFKVSQENNENMYESEAGKDMLNIFTRVRNKEIKDNHEKIIKHFDDIFKGGETLVDIPKINKMLGEVEIEEEKIMNKEEKKYPRGKIYDEEKIKKGEIILNTKQEMNIKQMASYGALNISMRDTVKRLNNKGKKIILIDFSCGTYVDTEKCNAKLN